MAHFSSTHEGLRELALFAGAGGGILGGHLLGWRTVCAVEWEPYPAAVLAQRQNDGILPPFPIWDDVRTFDGRPWRGIVDVVSGGFPCQDISVAGKGDGLDGESSGMWWHMARIIGEVRPGFVLVENSPALTVRGGERVTAKLAEMGYVGRNGVLSAADAGAPHRRERIWFVANSGHGSRRDEWIAQGREVTQSKRATDPDSASRSSEQPAAMADSDLSRWNTGGPGLSPGWKTEATLPCDSSQSRRGDPWWAAEPNVGRVADGVAARVDRLKSLGNGQVPAVVRLAWETLTK